MPHSTIETDYNLSNLKPFSSPSPPQPLTSFSLFPFLPLELRLQIYTYCLPSPRILELEFSPPTQTFVPIYFSYSSIPVLLHLISESRSFAIHYYQYIPSLNLWFSPFRDSFYFRIDSSQIYSPYYSAWVEKLGNLLRLGEDCDGCGYGLQRLRYLIIGDEAYSHLTVSSTILASLRDLKEIGVVTKEETLPLWPENEVILFSDRKTRSTKGKDNSIKGPSINYSHVRRRFKGVLMGNSDGSFVREEKRDPFAVGW